jgi:hypothetical protein
MIVTNEDELRTVPASPSPIVAALVFLAQADTVLAWIG